MAIYVATVVLNLSLAVAVGAALAALWLADATAPWSAAQLRRVRPVRLGASAAAIVASSLLLVFVSALMAEVDVAEAGEAVRAMLTESHFGLAWAVAMGALVAAALASAFPASGRWLRTVALVNLLLLGVVIYTRSMVSHAAADGDLSLALIVDWVHLCLVAVWVGAVLVAAFVTLGSALGEHAADRAQAAQYIKKLSSSATVALAGIFATGLFSAWHNLGSIAGLTGNAYGNLLLVKTGLVVFAVMLGGWNRFVGMPPLLASLRSRDAASAPTLGRFRRILRIEAAVLFAVLVIAAVLSATSPPTSA